MKLLIITETYPDTSHKYEQTYVHTRLLSYKRKGIEVEVISFKCRKHYCYEGISVNPPKLFKKLLKLNNFEAIICHAPNFRNHIRVLLINYFRLPYIIFVFHGHEILINNHYYPSPFDFQKTISSKIKGYFSFIYDHIKCFLLQKLIAIFGGKKLSLIFVSKYLKDLFIQNVKLSQDIISSFSAVIHNGLNEPFISENYNFSSPKTADFITIRPYDKSVYAIDIVLEIAKQNPEYNFHIYGKGNYFIHNTIPLNVKVFPHYFTPLELSKKLNNYKAALMPSYHDSQGVMACEMAAFGIPLIISKIPATKEMFKAVKNIFYLNNKKPIFNAAEFFKSMKPATNSQLINYLSDKNTAIKELVFIKNELDKNKAKLKKCLKSS